MDNEGKTIVEVNGVKMEVDLRTARVVENYAVGDSVKLLKKRYSDYEVLPAVIVGFSEFQKLPTIELLSVARNGEVEFHAFNAQTQDMEIAPFNAYELTFTRESVVERLQAAVNEKAEALRVAQAKLFAFTNNFGKVFKIEDQRA